ncbi:MAG TPA: DinB family protein [Fimbriiglobus sp.]|jgi:uncharacterized damage-inducible protein DinB
MPTLAELTEAYLAAPAKLRAVVKGMTREQAVARPVAGKWSTLECVCHLADFEPILADRIKRILAFEKPMLWAADENDYARMLAYQNRDLDEELAVIEAVRKSTARILKAQTDAALQRVGNHNLRGMLSLEQVLQMAVNHIPHHLKHLEDKRKALGL